MPLGTAFLAGSLDFLVHYHVDWSKQNLARFLGVTPRDNLFWVLIGIDQLLHQLTYLSLIWGFAAMTKKELQAFWMMGTIVRLASLGVIFPVPVALNTELCDLYNFLDAKKLFPESSDIRETLEDLISYFVALGCGAPTEKDVQGVEFLVKEYIENPLKLTRMFLEKEMSD